MSNMRSIATDVKLEIEHILYREARLLDQFLLREWLDTVLDPDIRYRMVMREEVSRKDKSPPQAREIFAYDDGRAILDMRVRQFESGVQAMLDPLPRMRRFITNIEAYHGEGADEYQVYSYGFATRTRRLYEREQIVFGREDIWRKGEDGTLRLRSRCVDLDERVIQTKNLLFFL